MLTDIYTYKTRKATESLLAAVPSVRARPVHTHTYSLTAGRSEQLQCLSQQTRRQGSSWEAAVLYMASRRLSVPLPKCTHITSDRRLEKMNPDFQLPLGNFSPSARSTTRTTPRKVYDLLILHPCEFSEEICFSHATENSELSQIMRFNYKNLFFREKLQIDCMEFSAFTPHKILHVLQEIFYILIADLRCCRMVVYFLL